MLSDASGRGAVLPCSKSANKVRAADTDAAADPHSRELAGVGPLSGPPDYLDQAGCEDRDPFTRLAVEFLARTGLRKSEFLDLTVDSVVQVGSAYWLHVRLGKLRIDRYIPLQAQLKQLLDEWIANRPAGLREPWLFIERARRIGKQRVQDAVVNASRAAGIGHVTPHQLRHTLATKAINRGMSLEAIAALLGHKSMRMTMVYAKIANRTVADEYFSVSEKVEALYDQPRELPATAEGAEMRKLRAEMHRRMLGNGYCARPVGLDCHFESICESCTCGSLRRTSSRAWRAARRTSSL
jgi:hypothetical protein